MEFLRLESRPDVEGPAMKLEARLLGKGAPLRARTMEARSHGALVLTMRGHEVAASALGPCFEFEPRLMRAVIDVRVDGTSMKLSASGVAAWLASLAVIALRPRAEASVS